jgi:hypothetical protein
VAGGGGADAGAVYVVAADGILDVPALAPPSLVGRPHPHPFRGVVVVPVLLSAGSGRALLLDVLGRRVRSWVWTDPPDALRWDGRHANGREAVPGVYFLEVRAGGVREVRTVILSP